MHYFRYLFAMSDSDSVDNPPQDVAEDNSERGRGRKKGRNVPEWKKSVCKRSRNSGKEYVSRSTGKVVKKREIGRACKEFYII